MSTWILIIFIGGFNGVSDVKHVPMTGDQCREAVRKMITFKGQVSAACFGPSGESFTFDDVGG